MTAPRTRKRPALDRVLATADRLFYTGGLHATGVDLIAQEAGVSKATLYTYFATKDDLVAEYLRRRSEAWRAHVAAQFTERGGTARDRILTIYDLLGEWFAEPGYRGCPFINAEAESGPDSPVHKVTRAHRTWVRELFTGLLTEAGVPEPALIALRLQLLYDAAMSSAQAEPEIPWAEVARRSAAVVVDAELA